MRTFEEFLDEALATPFEGWDFSQIEGRVEREGTPWNYAARASELALGASTMVDLGTGGGEVLSTLTRAAFTVATEGYIPNVALASSRLRPLGVPVVAYEGSPDNVDHDRATPQTLPFRDGVFDLVIDRHEAFNAADVLRVLRRGGTFFTQQVGGRDCIELCEALGGVTPQRAPTFDAYLEQLTGAGFVVVDAQESYAAKTFLDPGALLYYVLAVPWAFVGFSLETHRNALRAIYDRGGRFTTNEHRLCFELTKPAGS